MDAPEDRARREVHYVNRVVAELSHDESASAGFEAYMVNAAGDVVQRDRRLQGEWFIQLRHCAITGQQDRGCEQQGRNRLVDPFSHSSLHRLGYSKTLTPAIQKRLQMK